MTVELIPGLCESNSVGIGGACCERYTDPVDNDKRTIVVVVVIIITGTLVRRSITTWRATAAAAWGATATATWGTTAISSRWRRCGRRRSG